MKLHAFMMRHLRYILKSAGRTRWPTLEVLDKTGLPSMEDLLIRKNLHWTGFLMRMPSDRHHRQILFSQLPNGLGKEAGHVFGTRIPSRET